MSFSAKSAVASVRTEHSKTRYSWDLQARMLPKRRDFQIETRLSRSLNKSSGAEKQEQIEFGQLIGN